jgi:hypothetical protein
MTPTEDDGSKRSGLALVTREKSLPEALSWRLWGDVVVFRGDQRHSYLNPARRPAVGYSVVMLRPADGLP